MNAFRMTVTVKAHHMHVSNAMLVDIARVNDDDIICGVHGLVELLRSELCGCICAHRRSLRCVPLEIQRNQLLTFTNSKSLESRLDAACVIQCARRLAELEVDVFTSTQHLLRLHILDMVLHISASSTNLQSLMDFMHVQMSSIHS
jgi:hypothetical protein